MGLRALALAVAGVGYAYSSQIADAFGTSDGATIAFIAAAAAIVIAGTWFAYKKHL